MIITPKQRTSITIAVCTLIFFAIAFIVLVIMKEFWGYLGALIGIAGCIVWIGTISDEMNEGKH